MLHVSANQESAHEYNFERHARHGSSPKIPPEFRWDSAWVCPLSLASSVSAIRISLEEMVLIQVLLFWSRYQAWRSRVPPTLGGGESFFAVGRKVPGTESDHHFSHAQRFKVFSYASQVS